MLIMKIGQPQIAYETPEEGGSGGVAHPVEAPWASADGGVWNVGEGESAAPWHNAISEEGVREHIEAKGYKNPAELAMANFNLTKLQRGDPTVVGLPGADATPEQMGEFYGKLGRPDAPAGYEFKFGEDVKVDDKMVEFARNTFHEAGLTNAQAQAVADKWNEMVGAETGNAVEAAEAQNTKELNELETRWGADLDKNKVAGQRAMAALGLAPELIERVEQSIGSAAVVELVAMIGRKSDEGGFTTAPQGGDPNNPDTMSKAQASAKITELQSDEAFQKKYTDAAHPGHKDAVDLMQRLFARS